MISSIRFPSSACDQARSRLARQFLAVAQATHKQIRPQAPKTGASPITVTQDSGRGRRSIQKGSLFPQFGEPRGSYIRTVSMLCDYMFTVRVFVAAQQSQSAVVKDRGISFSKREIAHLMPTALLSLIVDTNIEHKNALSEAMVGCGLQPICHETLSSAAELLRFQKVGVLFCEDIPPDLEFRRLNPPRMIGSHIET